MTLQRKTIIIAIPLLILVAGLVIYAYRGTRGKTDIVFRIHINQQLVQESAFGESPTFAIWLEEPSTGRCRTVYVTRRAAVGDWEGKAEVPSALPSWFEVYKRENQTKELPGVEKQAPVAVTGATPEPGYFITRARVHASTTWKCWIEVNLSGDYNDHYQEYNEEAMTIDAYGNGQPALIYSALIDAVEGTVITPVIAGMCVPDFPGDSLIRPLKGITTAASVFDEISISLVKPNPSIAKH
jgi:hypothetical protein